MVELILCFKRAKFPGPGAWVLASALFDRMDFCLSWFLSVCNQGIRDS